MKNTLTYDLPNLFSENRLKSYKFSSVDDNSAALMRYLYNIQLSRSLYPLLSLLEISLRNKINQAIENTIKPNWLVKELEKQDILFDGEYKKLLDAKQKLIKKRHQNIGKDDLIAELSLGFWIHLCTKRYKTKLWHTKGFFRIIFAQYPNFQEFDKLSKVFPILQLMLQIRNRVFHHEIIINHPYGIYNCYSDLKRLLGYISKDCVEYLNKICDFEKIYKQKP